MNKLSVADVRAFLAIVDLGTFSAAAAHIGVAQATVSASIRRLEDVAAAGERLFVKERRGRERPQLTRFGRWFEQAVRVPSDDWAKLEGTISGAETMAPTGVLHIAAYPSVLHLLPRFIRDFVDEYRGVTVTLSAQDFSESVRALREHRIDLAFRPGSTPTIPKNLEFTELSAVARVVIARKGYLKTGDLTPAKLAKAAWILPPRSDRAPIRRQVESKLPGLHVRVECSDLMLTKLLVREGLGVSVVPELCLERSDLRELNVRSARDLFDDDVYGILSLRPRPATPAARAFKDFFVKRWAEAPPLVRASRKRFRRM